MLRFPTKAANAKRVVSFRDRNLRQRSALGQWLCRNVILKSCVCQTFHESVTESADRDSESLDCFGSRDVFDDVGISCARVNQLSAGCVDELTIRDMTGPEFHLLAECSESLGEGPRVINPLTKKKLRTKP